MMIREFANPKLSYFAIGSCVVREVVAFPPPASEN